MSNLQRHIPRLALEWAESHPDELHRAIEGTLCFADISGFTALAERLAQRGRVGGEELVETLGAVFSEMLEIARQRGGSLLKFGGDALLLFFQGDDHPTQAACAAVEMREALKAAGKRRTSVGRLRLAMSVGLHTGEIDFFLVGDRHKELVLLGPEADQIVAVEGAADAGEIVLSDAMAGSLPKSASRPRPDGQILLRWRKPIKSVPGPLPPGDWDPALVESLLPSDLCRHLEDGAPDPEHRIACIAFICFSGTSEMLAQEGAEAFARRLQRTMVAVERVLAAEGVTLLSVDLDDDGGKLFLAAGIPFSHEDDEGVMLRALRAIIDQQLPIPVQAGVSHGHVFVAEVGTGRRAAFSAMGDTTNVAARIASKASRGEIYVHPTVLDECLIRFETEQIGPLTMKGKAVPQVVYAIGDELGIRKREGLETDFFVGRENELARLTALFDDVTDTAGQVVCVTGGSGVGKTRLLGEFSEQLPDPQVLSFRAEPYGSNNPYRVLRDPLRQLVGVDRADEASMKRKLRVSVRRIDASLLPWLALIGDVLKIPVPPSAEVASLAPEFRPAKTAEVIIQLLEHLRPAKLLITLDGAQWCDDASAGLFTQLEKTCETRPWLLVALRRESEGGFNPTDGVQMQLSPLPDSDVKRLIHIATEAAPLRPQVVSGIIDRAAGYPLFAIELIRAIRDIGSLDTLPESIEAALAAQIDALDPSARRVLRYGSVLGRSYSSEILEQMFSAVGHSYDPSLVERLQRFLEEEQPGRFRFKSSLLRDTIYEELSYRIRTRLHRAAGEALENRAGDPATIASDLALHFSRGEDFSRAWKYSIEAGRRARSSFANTESARNFEIAIAASRRTSVEPEQMVSVFSQLGEVRERAGQLDEALAAYRRGLRLTDAPLTRAQLLCDMAWAKQRAGHLSAAQRNAAEGIKVVTGVDAEQPPPVLARLLSLQSFIVYNQDRPGRALEIGRNAADVARSTGEQEALVRALTAIELAELALTGNSDGRWLREALSIAEAMEHRGLQASIYANLSGIDYYSNRWDEALAGYRRTAELYEATGNYIDSAMCLVNASEILINQGHYPQASGLLTEAIRVMRASGFGQGMADADLQLARIELANGDAEASLERASAAEAAYEALGEPHYVLQARLIGAEAVAGTGRYNDALIAIDNAVAAAGDEAVYLRTKVAIARATSLIGLDRLPEARAELKKGLEVAEDQEMRFESALLNRMLDEVEQSLADNPDSSRLADAEQTLKELGVVI